MQAIVQCLRANGGFGKEVGPPLKVSQFENCWLHMARTFLPFSTFLPTSARNVKIASFLASSLTRDQILPAMSFSWFLGAQTNVFALRMPGQARCSARYVGWPAPMPAALAAQLNGDC
jgi:hypothetical protein